MKTNVFVDDLKTLQSHAGEPCISIIIPTYQHEADRKKNKVVIEVALKKAKKVLAESASGERIKILSEKIDQCYSELDLAKVSEGVGVFVSLDVSLTVYFPLPVKEKVIIGNKFEVRDLVYAINRMTKYWVLVLSKNTSGLYFGFGNTLTEVQDENFPFPFEDQYQHQQPSPPYDADTSSEVHTRGKQYFRKVDKLLHEYLVKEAYPLIVVGVEQYLGYFEQVTKHKKSLIAKIPGHFDKRTFNELTQHAWNVIQKFNADERNKVLKELEEAIGKKMCVWGLTSVSQAAYEGKGSKLIVEKNYMAPFITNGESVSVSKRAKKLSDVVDDVVDLVLQKGGKVFFIENGDLKQYDKIALILRYAEQYKVA